VKDLKCPQCRKAVIWHDNPHRPFCSDRSRLLDLGEWADESYRVKGPSEQPWNDENISQINSEKQDIERS